jgi:hypothetical protein
MKKLSIHLIIGMTLCFWISCSDNNNTNNNTNTNTNSGSSIPEATNQNSSGSTSEKPNLSESNSQEQKKTDGELILEGGVVLLNSVTDEIDKQKIRDSIRQVNKAKMYAYQIGIKMRESDACEARKKLVDANIPSVYVFKGGRKEYYVVQFDAKGEEELNLSLGNFKSKLGELGNEGLKVINLNDFCSKRENVARRMISQDGDKIKCLYCD